MTLREILLCTQVIFTPHWKNIRQQSEQDFDKVCGDSSMFLPGDTQHKMYFKGSAEMFSL